MILDLIRRRYYNMTVRTIFNDDPTKFKFDEVKNTLAKEWNEEPESIDNDDVWDRIYNEIDWTFDDEFNNLDIKTENDIIAIANMGLWYGKRTGYKLLSRRNLNEIMCCGGEDYNHLYYDGFNVYKEAIHHDGTNYIMFREVRPDVNIEKLCDIIYNNEVINRATLNRYTRSLRRYVKRIYGW